MSPQRTTRRHFYLLPHIIPVNNPPKTPGDFQKNPPYPGVLNVQFPAPIPRHGVGSPGDDGAPTPGLASLVLRVWNIDKTPFAQGSCLFKND